MFGPPRFHRSMSLLDPLLRLTALSRMPRTGWLQAGVPAPESVAAHSLGAALVALALAPRVRPPVDVDRCVALAAVHDAPEALLGDLPKSAVEHLPAGAKEHAEAGAAQALLGPLNDTALARFREFADQSTREARLARLCDKLHLGLELLALARVGWKVAPAFADGLARLDAAEFPPCAELRDEILAALDPPASPDPGARAR